jgi:choice-of-anchor A domain-containing protein
MSTAAFRRTVIAATAALALAAPAAKAAPLAEDLLREFNLIVLGNLTSNAEVEGRTYVRGNLGGNASTYYTRDSYYTNEGLQPPLYADLVVGGNVTGGFKNVNDSGDAWVAGTVENMNMNGGQLRHGGAITGNVNGSKVQAPVIVPDFAQTMFDYSAQVKAMAANNAVAVSGNRATFTAANLDAGLAVFDIADGTSFFSAIGEIELFIAGATTVVINVGGTGPMTIAENFIGGSNSVANATKLLWNFHAATSIAVGAEFVGSMLAPGADLANTISINGSVVVNNFTQNGEVHVPTFSGRVPQPPPSVSEPATLALFGAGLFGLAVLRRRGTAA